MKGPRAAVESREDAAWFAFLDWMADRWREVQSRKAAEREAS